MNKRRVVTSGETGSSSSYWVNWRVVLCAILVLISMGFASFIIWKFEGPKNGRNNVVTNSETRRRRRKDKNDRKEEEEEEEECCGVLYCDEVWMPCLKGMHPGWLLAFRVCAFLVLLLLLIVNAIVDGASIFYYYTQWTFTLVTIYFGLGSLLSIKGCYEYHNSAAGEKVHNHNHNLNLNLNLNHNHNHNQGMDLDMMTYVDLRIPIPTNNNNNTLTSPQLLQHARPTARFWAYLLQILFQMNAGAVMLTDMVFWFIIVPFLTTKNHHLNFFKINMHTVNLVFLLADTAFNSLRFPWFRIGYFILWTSIFVIFQWLLHASISIWWPYPFLDLSSSYAPLWYSTVAVMHIPCYAIFFLIIKLKHFIFSTYFPHSYQCPPGLK